MERRDPDLATSEKSTLEQFLDYQRATLLIKTEGLTHEQLNQRLAPSTLTLAGLLKHLALVEDDWIQFKFLGRPETDIDPWGTAPWEQDRDWEFSSAEKDTADELRALYLAACERSRQSTAAAELADLSTTAGRHGEHWSLRWVLTHLIEETARHNGHADLLREAIDGDTGQ